jgi:hypothetical protein
MSQELVYTSAPRGLRPGSRGFCTVLSTQGMPAPLAATLEGLSGYRPLFPPADPRAAENPVVWSHLKVSAVGRTIHVLSRIADCGLDYSNRANKLAHHIALDANELLSGGPANLLRSPGLLRSSWSDEPRVVPPKTIRTETTPPLGVCTAWKAMTGDAGWAGVLAESFRADPERIVILLFAPGQDMLPLFAEAISLLPADQRWNATFSTYFTALAPAVKCVWRAMIHDSKEAHESLRLVNALRIDLTSGNLGPAAGGPLVTAARTGVRPHQTPPRLPTAASAVKQQVAPQDDVVFAGVEDDDQPIEMAAEVPDLPVRMGRVMGLESWRVEGMPDHHLGSMKSVRESADAPRRFFSIASGLVILALIAIGLTIAFNLSKVQKFFSPNQEIVALSGETADQLPLPSEVGAPVIVGLSQHMQSKGDEQNRTEDPKSLHGGGQPIGPQDLSGEVNSPKARDGSEAGGKESVLPETPKTPEPDPKTDIPKEEKPKQVEIAYSYSPLRKPKDDGSGSTAIFTYEWKGKSIPSAADISELVINQKDPNKVAIFLKAHEVLPLSCELLVPHNLSTWRQWVPDVADDGKRAIARINDGGQEADKKASRFARFTVRQQTERDIEYELLLNANKQPQTGWFPWCGAQISESKGNVVQQVFFHEQILPPEDMRLLAGPKYSLAWDLKVICDNDHLPELEMDKIILKFGSHKTKPAACRLSVENAEIDLKDLVELVDNTAQVNCQTSVSMQAKLEFSNGSLELRIAIKGLAGSQGIFTTAEKLLGEDRKAIAENSAALPSGKEIATLIRKLGSERNQLDLLNSIDQHLATAKKSLDEQRKDIGDKVDTNPKWKEFKALLDVCNNLPTKVKALSRRFDDLGVLKDQLNDISVSSARVVHTLYHFEDTDRKLPITACLLDVAPVDPSQGAKP